jgi:hypothetical protein
MSDAVVQDPSGGRRGCSQRSYARGSILRR